jgi:Helix-loop-helix DNA-binding domain
LRGFRTNCLHIDKAAAPGTPSLSAETSALYLASKSNYQNILEGTHLPGVSYPEALAENLSSKRTSHKLAEQGRRNRINVALKEMEALLPPIPFTKGKRDRSGSIDSDLGDKSAASNNSKASTVELAIAYIRALQAELADTKAKLEAKEKQLAETNNSSGDNASQSPQ